MLNKVDGTHDHARCAKAALQGVQILKRGLHWVKRSRRAYPLNGGHLCAVRLRGENRSRFHSPAIEMHRARAALTGITAHMRAGQS